MISDFLPKGPTQQTGSLLDAFQAAASTTVSSEWGNGNSYSLTDIRSDNSRRFSEQQSSTGWRVKDGVKTYKSFRYGKPVEASGKEGFILAMADSKTAETKKRKRSSELAEDETGEIPRAVHRHDRRSSEASDTAGPPLVREGGPKPASAPNKRKSGNLKSWFQDMQHTPS